MAGVAVNAACVSYRPPPPPVPATENRIPYTEVWRAKAGRGFSGPMAIRDGMLYAGGVDRKIYAVDLASGETRWSTRLPGAVVGGVVLRDSIVYAGSDRPIGRLVALRARNGSRLWQKSPGRIASPPALVGDRLVVPTREGLVLGLDPATGRERWRLRQPGVRVQPVPVGDSAFVLATLDSLFLVRAADGRVRRRAASPGAVLAPWTPHDGLLVAGTSDSSLVALDAARLTVAWALPLDAPVFTAPTARGDTLWVATRVGTVYRVVSNSEARAERVAELRWPTTTSPVPFRDLVLLGGADGRLRAIDAQGREAWRVALWQPVDVPPIVLPDGVVAIGGNGDMHRYRP